MLNVTLSPKGGIVIPAELRKKYGLKPGARLQFVDYGGIMELIPLPADPIEAAAGMLKSDRSLTAALLAEHQHEQTHER